MKASRKTPVFDEGEFDVQVGNNLEFRCIKEGCGELVKFSVFDTSKNNSIRCGKCGKEYTFGDDLMGKLEKFEKLCRAVNEADDILSDTNVGINVYSHEVRIPFRLLLTRLNTQLNLNVGGKDIQIRFRVSPSKDMPQAAEQKP
jgi:hypothetical protein